MLRPRFLRRLPSTGTRARYGDPGKRGLDDRLARGKVLERAEKLMTDAVRAEHTFFSTCGSSLSLKVAMLAMTCPGRRLLVGRDAHKPVVARLILSGVDPAWVEPQWDPVRHTAHPPPTAAYDEAFAEHPDADGALVTSPTPYGAAADLQGIADVCPRHDKLLIVDEAWGARLPFRWPPISEARQRIRPARWTRSRQLPLARSTPSIRTGDVRASAASRFPTAEGRGRCPWNGVAGEPAAEAGDLTDHFGMRIAGGGGAEAVGRFDTPWAPGS